MLKQKKSIKLFYKDEFVMQSSFEQIFMGDRNGSFSPFKELTSRFHEIIRKKSYCQPFIMTDEV